MRLLNAITVTLLLGAAACSSEPVGTPGANESTPAPQAVGFRSARTAAPHRAVATASLDTLAGLVAQGNPETRGFHSNDEVGIATLAEPMPMYMMGLDGLRAYHPGQDPHTLLIDKEEAMYPLTVGGEVRSSVVVTKNAAGTWETTSFGHANLAKAAYAGRRGVAANRGVAEAELSIVDVPTLGARLLAHEENGKLMLTPMHDVPGTAFRAGDTRSAEEVIAALHPLAVQANGSVPN